MASFMLMTGTTFARSTELCEQKHRMAATGYWASPCSCALCWWSQTIRPTILEALAKDALWNVDHNGLPIDGFGLCRPNNTRGTETIGHMTGPTKKQYSQCYRTAIFSSLQSCPAFPCSNAGQARRFSCHSCWLCAPHEAANRNHRR